MSTYTFKYGSGSVDLELGDGGRIEHVDGTHFPAIENIPAALVEAMECPIGGPPIGQYLNKGDKVTLIISDMSRFWMRQDLIVPHIIDYIRSRCFIDARDIVILVATGTHDPCTKEELRSLVTGAVYDQIEVVNHSCLARDLVHIGTTSRGTDVEINPLAIGRKVIALGAVSHHVMAGYGGGRKSILPGICSMRSIKQNHAHSLHPLEARSNPAIGNTVLAGNPLHEDMCEAAAMLDDLFVVNLVMNTSMQLAKITAGHRHDSWLTACKALDKMYEVRVPAKADVIITSCGGYPKDMSLYQSTKAIDNVEGALKPGGTLVLLAECRDGGGPAEYFDWLASHEAGTLDSELRANFTIPGYVFYLNCEQAKRYNIIMLTTADAGQLAKMGITAVADPAKLLENLDLAGKHVYIISNGSAVLPVTGGSR